ncbi:hypothetical protein BDZ91DRAFT_799919 [Kalaharituber pfeilii]|nr:hypothetical protein BDZ91DRAFT_799919 [Kalaharituber pfeilii]
MIFTGTSLLAAVGALSMLASNMPQAAADLQVRSPTPQKFRGRYSSFAAENDALCCPEGVDPADGCCEEGFICDVSNSTSISPICVEILPTSTNNSTNNSGTHNPVPSQTESEEDSGSATTFGEWGIWTASVAGLIGVVGAML